MFKRMLLSISVVSLAVVSSIRPMEIISPFSDQLTTRFLLIYNAFLEKECELDIAAAAEQGKDSLFAQACLDILHDDEDYTTWFSQEKVCRTYTQCMELIKAEIEGRCFTKNEQQAIVLMCLINRIRSAGVDLRLPTEDLENKLANRGKSMLLKEILELNRDTEIKDDQLYLIKVY